MMGGERPDRRTVVLVCAGLAFLWALFWLHDQRMYDDDYGRWLNPAQDLSYSQILGQLLRPFPPDWGFLDRPALMACFKLGRDLFGSHQALWFVSKAAVFAGLVAAFGTLTLRVATSAGFAPRSAAIAAAVAVALFTTSDPAFASLLWLSDMEVAAQLSVAVAVLLYLRATTTAADRPLPGRPIATLILLVVVAFIGFKFKPTAKVLPLLLGAHVVIFARTRARLVLPVVALLIAACIPWGGLGAAPLPPMLDFDGRFEWFYWRPANLDAAGSLIWGAGPTLAPLGLPDGLPTGLLETWFPFGLLLTVAGLAVSVRAALGGARDGAQSLVWLWLGLLLLTLSIAPDIPGPLLGRYLFAVQLPLALLAGLGTGWAVGLAGTRGRRLVVAGAVGLVVLQIAVGFTHTRTRKRSQGCQLSIADKTAELVHSSLDGATVFFLGSPVPRYDRSAARNEIVSATRQDPGLEARLRAASPRVALVTDQPLRPGAPWRLLEHLRAEDEAYWRLVGPPLGRCERFVHQPSGL